MGIYNLRDASLVVNSVNLSDHVRSITITMNADDLDATAMGAVSHTHVPGLRDDRMEVDFFQDHAAGSVDATLSAMFGVAAGVTIVCKPTSATVGPTNPTFTMTGILLDYSALSGEVGNLSRIPVVFAPAQGSSIVRATA